VCILYRGNVSTQPFYRNDNGIFTEPLPSNDKRIFTEPLLSNNKGTFTKPLPSNDKGDTQTHTHTQTATLSHKPTLFFQNKESRLKIAPSIVYGVLCKSNRIFAVCNTVIWLHADNYHISLHSPTLFLISSQSETYLHVYTRIYGNSPSWEI
jgi:hypothetical protein